MFVHGPSSHLAQSLGDVDSIQPIPYCWGVPTCPHVPNVLAWKGRETSSRADPHVSGLAAGLARADTWVCPYIQCRHRAPSTKPPAPRVGADPCVRPLNDQALWRASVTRLQTAPHLPPPAASAARAAPDSSGETGSPPWRNAARGA